jgi:imidazole glycerol-phosphate synthase subunit HisH
MSVVIVDYGIGNLGSIPNMLKRLGTASVITSDPDRIRGASRLILPGVGAFDAGMRRLRELDLEPVLQEKQEDGTPILGLCLGMQLLFERSAEGSESGLGWIDGEIVRFDLADRVPPLPVPHMGWNFVIERGAHPILAGLGSEPRFYFAHSYYAVCTSATDIVAETDYGGSFPSVVARENVVGAQFHPEKSHRFGLQFLRNFLELE